MRKAKKLISMLIVTALAASMLAACGTPSESSSSSAASSESSSSTESSAAEGESSEATEGGEVDWMAPYEETVNYTAAKASINYAPLEGTEWEGDSDNDNQRTRDLFEKFNFQSEILFTGAEGEDYDQKVSLAIVDGNIPDVMMVYDYATVKELAENDLIMDLTEVYDTWASDNVKAMYDSYGGAPLNASKVDGKLMAIPETSISTGPEFVWLRQDWLTELGLEAPTTTEGLEEVLTAFVENNMGGDNTVGLTLNYEYGTYGAIFQGNNLYAAHDAYPAQWVEKDGKAVYGSIQPEMRDALEMLADWYSKGLIDAQLATRDFDSNTSLISSGQSGAFNALWWGVGQNNPGAHAKTNDPEAEWVGCLIEDIDEGGVSIVSGDPANKYVVVRKDFEHPEIVFKTLNYLYDYLRNSDELTEDDVAVNDPYGGLIYEHALQAFPINIDYFDAGERIYEQTLNFLNGEEYEFQDWYVGTADQIKSGLEKVEAGEEMSLEEWAAVRTRYDAYKMMTETGYDSVVPVFFGVTDSMKLRWETIQTAEQQMILQVITGEKGIEAFDEFVAEWSTLGGDTITDEVNAFLGL